MQTSFSELEYAAKKKLTRRDRFLAERKGGHAVGGAGGGDWAVLPEGRRSGRPPIGLHRMLRMYIAQQCFGLSDEGIEDALYDSQAIRRFVGIDLARESAPDATTLLKFRRLLETNELTRKVFEAINAHLAERGLILREGTIVDATFIAAPPSTKNKAKARDPEMHQAKKGNNWHFGMKAHIGVDAKSGLVHAVIGTAATVSDVSQTHALVHGEESDVFGDAGYQGVEKRSENQGSTADWHIAMKRGKRKGAAKGCDGKAHGAIREAQGQHPCEGRAPVSCSEESFKHRKTCYRGLAKNEAQLFSLFGLRTWCSRASD